MKAIVTLKIKPPYQEKTTDLDILPCPLNKNKGCTDATGQEHSTIVFGKNMEEIKKQIENLEVKRIEIIDNENYPEHYFATFVLNEGKDRMKLAEIFKKHQVIKWELYQQYEQIDESNQAIFQCIAVEWKIIT